MSHLVSEETVGVQYVTATDYNWGYPNYDNFSPHEI